LSGLASVDDADLPDVLGLTGGRIDVSSAAFVSRGIAYMYQGRLSAARCALEGVPDDAHGVWRAIAMSSLALVEAWSGNLTTGEQLALRAVSFAEHVGLGDSPITNARHAFALVALQRGDLGRAGPLLAGWSEDRGPRARLERRLWLSIVKHLEGDEAGACANIAAVVAEAEPQHNVDPFILAGRHALGPARTLYKVAPTAFLRTIVDRPVTAGRAIPVKEFVEQLTEREYIVLALLPTRLSNTEIAERLGVSLNT